MTALFIVLAGLLVLGFLPMGAKLRYDDGDLEVRLKIGPFRIPLLPVKQPHGKKLAKQHGRKIRAEQKKLKKKAEKKARKKKKAEEEKQKTKEQRARERLEQKKKKLSFDELMQIARLALDMAGRLPRKLTVNELYLHVTFGGRDAAKAAVGYGRAWAAVGAAMPVLRKTFRIRRENVGVELDCERENLGIFGRLDIHMLVGTATLLAFGTGFRFLKLLIENKLKLKKEV